MAILDLLPDRRNKSNVPVRREEWSSPFASLQREMNRLFDNFFGEYTPARFEESFGGYLPKIDVKETNKDVLVEAELPGMDEKDIDISISDDILTLRGEKRMEKEEKESGFYRMERTYGSFHRDIPLPCEVESTNVEAVFRKGVLTVHLPKKPEAQRKAKKIAIKTG